VAGKGEESKVIVAVRASTPADLAAIVEAIETAKGSGPAPGVRLAVRAAGQLLASLDQPLLDRLAAVGGAIEWLGGGWADPVLAMLPRRDRRLQLQTDVDTISATVGATIGGAWLALGAWQGFLAETLAVAGLRYVLIDAGAFIGKVEAGIVDHLGTTLVAVPIGQEAAVTPVTAADLGAVLAPNTETLTPSEYLDLHPPTERVALVEDWPGSAAPRWRQQLAFDPGADLLYRKMLRLSAKWSDRVPPPSQPAFLSAQSHAHYLGGGDREEGHRLLVAARTADRRTGSVLATEDWDADGQAEIHIELAELSAVLDPGTTSLSYLDDKTVGWPVMVRPVFIEPLGAFTSEVVELSEHRGKVEVRLGSPRLAARFALEGRTVEITLSKQQIDDTPVGPRLPINLRGGAQLRIDGGAWTEVASGREVSGHRFRIQAADRGVVITLAKPGEMSIELAGSELVIWPHAIRALEMSMELT